MRLVSATIFKDEYDHLQRLLRSLKGKVDAAVCIGTDPGNWELLYPDGEGEASIECDKYWPPTFQGHFDWIDDFSAAKNVALKDAENPNVGDADWIIVIDSDEELEEDSPGEFRRVCESLNTVGFGIDVVNVNKEGKRDFVSRQWRVLRTGLGIRYHGRIHEQLIHPDGAQELPWVPTVRLLHYGYQDDTILLGPKMERNMRLLKRALKEQPNDSALWHQFGAQLLLNGTPLKALFPLKKAIALWKASPNNSPQLGHVRPMYYRLLSALCQLGRTDQVLAVYEQAPLEAICSDMLYWVGYAALRQGRLKDAEHFLTLAMQVPGDDIEFQTWRPLVWLASAYELSQQFDKAFDTLMICYRKWGRNNDPQVLLGLGSISKNSGQPTRARAWAEQVLNGDFSADWKERAASFLATLSENHSEPRRDAPEPIRTGHS